MFGHAHYQVSQWWNTNGEEKSVCLYDPIPIHYKCLSYAITIHKRDAILFGFLLFLTDLKFGR
jgi:hypothetical protein